MGTAEHDPAGMEALKASILASAGLSPDDTTVVLIPNPENQLFICRIEVSDPVTRTEIRKKYGGFAIQKTVYFEVSQP